MFKVLSNALQPGDRLAGPFQGGMITVFVGTVMDLPDGQAYADMQPEGMLRQVWPEAVDLEKLPAGWRHLRGSKVLHTGE